MPKITDYQPLQHNPNKGTQKGAGVLEKSVRELGAGRSLLVDKNGVIIAGNHVQEAFVNVGIDDVIEVETDGTQIVVVKRTDMDAESAEGKKMAIMDNRASELGLSWDEVVVEQMLDDIKVQDGEIDNFLSELLNEAPAFSDDEVVDDETLADMPMVENPSAVFPSANEYGIPDLPLYAQARFVEPPIVRWGRFARHNNSDYASILHFYTEDYKFNALWSDPTPIITSGCKAIIEPNISLCKEYPFAFVLWNTYRKRWVSAYASSYGVKIFVDLNVPEEFDELNLLGVPDGWKSYATRHYTEFGIAELERQYGLACDKAGTNENILFLVAGGGNNVKQACNSNGWHHIDLITEVNHG